MAGIAKIASKDLDEVNKINSAVLIGLGDALVANVLSPKTFYAGSTVLLTGVMPTVAIVAANDNYPAGCHAGNVGGLDAIDTDLAPANIKAGVTIFGKVGTSIALTDYHYYEDVAAWATYTPPALSLAILCNESGLLDWDYISLKFYDGSGWIGAHDDYSELECTANVFQDNSQNIRVQNGSGTAYKISLTGVIWSGVTDYHYYEDLAASATYTPSVQSIATLCNEYNVLTNTRIHLEFYNGAAWINSHSGGDEATCLVLQDNSQNVRVANEHTSAWKISLTGIIWS